MALSVEENKKIAENQGYINKYRNNILSEFAPTFCFHKNEDSFPMDPDDYVKDVVMAKYRHYTKNKDRLNQNEKIELHLIESYFLTKEKNFNPNYEQDPNFHEFKNLMAEDGNKKENERLYDKFLTFDEKKYGYKLGSQVPIEGIHPSKNPKEKAPCYTAITPTPDGFRIKYEYFYSISSCIPGTKGLYENLPYEMSKRAKHFAFHAGDWEGVEMNLKFDPKSGKPIIDSMQTFAHGRKGASTVPANQLTYTQDGRPCVFVGQGTHPSYAHNFVGRNKFMDLTGDKYKITPTKFVNLEQTAPKQDLPNFIKAGFIKQGSPDNIYSQPNKSSNAFTHEEYLAKSPSWNNYKPKMFLDKIYNKVKNTLLGLFGEKPKKYGPKEDFNLPPIKGSNQAIRDRLIAETQKPEISQKHVAGNKKAVPTKPVSWKERDKASKAAAQEATKSK